MQRPRLRDNKGKRQFELYPLGQIPLHMICEMGSLNMMYTDTSPLNMNGVQTKMVTLKALIQPTSTVSHGNHTALNLPYYMMFHRLL